MISNDTQNPGNLACSLRHNGQIYQSMMFECKLFCRQALPASDVKTTQNIATMAPQRLRTDLLFSGKFQFCRLISSTLLAFLSQPNTCQTTIHRSHQAVLASLAIILLLPVIILPIIAIIVIIAVVGVARKSTYASPKVSMETLGVKRGLTAVEASYLLDLKPTQIVTEILYSLLQKRAVWAQETKPALKLQVLAPYENKTGTADNPLRYYEIDFLNSLKADGTLDEEKLAHTIMFLRDTVEQKLQGYSRKDTVDYYKKIVDQAWTQVQQAGTEQLASNAYDEQLLWLMLDPNQKTRTETVFQNRVFQPDPLWFWWWYGYTTYHPNPTYQTKHSSTSTIS